MSEGERSPNHGSPNKLRPKLDEYKVLAKPRKSKKRPKRMVFSERCQGPFWINYDYRNVIPAHVCCGHFHKSLVSKSAKDEEMSKIEEEDEDVSALEKKFEANEEMKKVEKAKTMDGQENDTVVVETDLVRFIKSSIISQQHFFRTWI